jgi:phospholipase/carboxylesterase
MDDLYPDGDYEVIGEIGNSTKKYVSQDIIETKIGKSIPIFPRGSLKKPFEWVAGYASVGENTYVAVVKSIIPRLG